MCVGLARVEVLLAPLARITKLPIIGIDQRAVAKVKEVKRKPIAGDIFRIQLCFGNVTTARLYLQVFSLGSDYNSIPDLIYTYSYYINAFCREPVRKLNR